MPPSAGSALSADLNTFLLGVRDNANGWEFFYQRSAVLNTLVDVVQCATPVYHRKNWFHALKSDVGMEHRWKLDAAKTNARQPMVINHRLTSCQRLDFP